MLIKKYKGFCRQKFWRKFEESILRRERAGVGKEKCGLLSIPDRGKEDIAARLAKRQCYTDPANIEMQEPPLSSSRSSEALPSEIRKSKACP